MCTQGLAIIVFCRIEDLDSSVLSSSKTLLVFELRNCRKHGCQSLLGRPITPDQTLVQRPWSRTEADNKFQKNVRDWRCHRPVPPSCSPSSHLKGRTSSRKIITQAQRIILFKISLGKHDLFKKWPNVQDINWMNQLLLELFPYNTSFFSPSIKNTSNLHAVTSTTVSAQDSQAVTLSPNNNSLDGFTYQTGTFTLWLTGMLKEGADKKTTDLFIGRLKLYLKTENCIPAVEAGEPLQSLLEEHQKKHSGEEKQYAFAIVFLKDCKTVIFPLVYPRHSDSIIRDTLHSEEILIPYLDNFFQNNGANVQDVFIYTHNSPCTKRDEQHIDPCMSLLRKKADQWHNEYGFFTAVAFKEFWGQSRPNYFNYLQYSNISSSKFLKVYIEECENIPFKLRSKYFNKLNPELFKNKDIQSGLKKLKELITLSGVRKAHLERVEKILVHLENLQDQDIRKKDEIWRRMCAEMINNSFMLPIRKAIYRDLSAAQVNHAVKNLQLGKNSPLQLYHILDRN